MTHTRRGRSHVLRRPPLHKRANSYETMRREARVLAALAGSDVPHPGLIAACAVDWELCTIGDPLLDLGHLLATWPPRGSDTTAGTVGGGIEDLPDESELVERYAERTARSVEDVDWYHAPVAPDLGSATSPKGCLNGAAHG